MGYDQIVRLAGENPHRAPSVNCDLGQGSKTLRRGDVIYLEEGMVIEVIRELESLCVKLKCGEYDGVDIMEARIAIKRLITLLKEAGTNEKE